LVFHCVDIVEGMVNKGIYLNGDNGATYLHFGNYKDSCISDPTLCGPAGEFLISSCTLFRCYRSASLYGHRCMIVE